MSDTTRDIRILFLEKVYQNLQQQVDKGFFGSKKRLTAVADRLKEVGSTIMTMKYSYLNDQGLYETPEHESLTATAREIVQKLSELHPDDLEKKALLRFYREVFSRFKQSFLLPATIESAVPVDIGKVITTGKHPKAKNLIICHVYAFGEKLVIVTNLVKTKPGQLMKVAMVEPAPVMGILSEAQFVGEARREKPPDEPVKLKSSERQEIRRSMASYL